MENNFVQEYLNNISATNSTKTSIQHLQKNLSQQNLQPGKRASFIPFIKERDGMNKILSVNPVNEIQTDNQISVDFYSLSTPKLRLRRKIIPVYPSVGSYNLKSDWIKKSFSTKNVSFTATKPLIQETSQSRNRVSREETKSKGTSEQKYRKPDNRFEEVIERKEFRNFAQRPLGTWNSLRVHGTPKGIKEELEFNQELMAIKKYQIEIKSLLNELKR